MTEPNEPVNPTIWDDRHNPNFVRDNDGISKREYFAAKAMQGIRANSYLMLDAATAAQQACNDADALIEALNREGEQ